MNAMSREFRIYERRTEGSEGLPEWCCFFLIDEAADDVFVPAAFLGETEAMIYMWDGELVVCPQGSPRQITGKPFVSARAVAVGDFRFDELRRDILRDFRACQTVVDAFD